MNFFPFENQSPPRDKLLNLIIGHRALFHTAYPFEGFKLNDVGISMLSERVLHS